MHSRFKTVNGQECHAFGKGALTANVNGSNNQGKSW